MVRKRKRGELEAQVMNALWSGPHALTVREVLNQLPEPRPAYTTVSTVLERLRAKGRVNRTTKGRGYCFAPVQTDDEHTSDVMLSALGASRDREAALLKFAGNLDDTDIDLLRQAFGG